MNSKFEVIGKYKTGLEQIDKLHQYLFDLFYRLSVLIEEKGSDEELNDIIKDFLSYTVFHFKDEESFMRNGRISETQ